VISVESIDDLFDKAIPREFLKASVLTDIKQRILIGVPEVNLEVDLEPADGSDILIQEKQIDPEKALGYRVFPSKNSYFSYLDAQLYVPQESDFKGGS
jgi:hypothetical protein